MSVTSWTTSYAPRWPAQGMTTPRVADPRTRVTERLEQCAPVHSEDSGYGYSRLGVPVATAIRCQSAHGVVVSSVAAHPESDRFP